MGAYTYLTVADYPLFATMNSYSQELINLIFQPEDFIIENRKFSAKSKLFWGDTYKNEKATFRFKGFKQTAKICKERLEIFGMTLQRAKKEFPLAKKISVEEGYYDFALSKVTFNQYQNEISDIISKGDISYNQLYTNLRESLITGDLGILGQSLECQLYSILRVVPEDSVVEYDFTDVILGGWLKETDVRQVSFEKILILTEGKTDVEFIRDSIKKMYPYLSPYYHFIDFKGYTVESNASALVKMVHIPLIVSQ